MSAAWITALVPLLVALGAVAAWLISAGRREGKLDAALEMLTKIADDHEQRLRRGGL